MTPVEHHPDVGIGQMPLDLAQKAGDGSFQLRNLSSFQVEVARDPDDERGVIGLERFDQCSTACRLQCCARFTMRPTPAQ